MRSQFFNINMDVIDQQQVFALCENMFKSTQTHTLYFLNAHCFNVAQKNRAYHEALMQSDLLLNDGMGLKLGSYFAGFRFKENLNGTDLIPKLLALAAHQNRKVFFLGAKQGVAKKAAENVKMKIENLQISGYHSGYFDRKQEQALIEAITGQNTDILVIGMGVPRQEIWAHQNKEKLKGVKLIIAGGAILDFLSGEISRAPAWMRKTGTEWVYRLMLEPGRMWRRYLIGNFLFFYHIIRLKLNYD